MEFQEATLYCTFEHWRGVYGTDHAAKEGIWIQQFLGDVLFTTSVKMTILGDNQGTLALMVNPAYHAHTKHICVHHHFIQECIENRDIKLEYIPTGDQVADVLTKGLPIAKHDKFIKAMGLIGVSTHWVGMLKVNSD